MTKILSSENIGVWHVAQCSFKKWCDGPARGALDFIEYLEAQRIGPGLIKAQGIGVYQLYAFCHKNDIEYDLAYIPGKFPDTSADIFDPQYMSILYELGRRLGRQGYAWKSLPPRLRGAH